VGEQPERAAIGVALVVEDSGREILWPDFASRRCGHALGAGGAQGEGAPFGPVRQLGAASRGRAKQWPTWSRAVSRAAEQGRRKVKWVTTPSDDVRSIAQDWPTHVGGDDLWPLSPSALHMVSAATGSRGGARDRMTIPGGQTETGR
jgi:hypothetical protein